MLFELINDEETHPWDLCDDLDPSCDELPRIECDAWWLEGDDWLERVEDWEDVAPVWTQSNESLIEPWDETPPFFDIEPHWAGWAGSAAVKVNHWPHEGEELGKWM